MEKNGHRQFDFSGTLSSCFSSHALVNYRSYNQHKILKLKSSYSLTIAEKVALLKKGILPGWYLKKQQSPVRLFWFCPWGKLGQKKKNTNDYHDVKLHRFKMFSLHTKTQNKRFQIPPLSRAFSKSSVFVEDLSGRYSGPNCGNKAAFSNSSGLKSDFEKLRFCDGFGWTLGCVFRFPRLSVDRLKRHRRCVGTSSLWQVAGIPKCPNIRLCGST